jgi:heavy metal sensor kinase
MLDSVRTRLTFWYVGVLALSLIGFALVIYYAAAAIFYERQDESLRSTAQTVASAYMEELEEEKSVAKANEVVMTELVFPDRYVLVTDNLGQATASSRNFAGQNLQLSTTTLNLAHARGFSYATTNGIRVAIVPLSADRSLGFAAVAEQLSVIDVGLSRLRRDFMAGVLLILVLATASGYFLARKSLLPIASMNSQTKLITAERLSSRLDVRNPRDELGRLATTINELLTRLENSFRGQQRFIADASHELRTPLAVLRGETEVALGKTRSTGEYRESLTLIQDEAERLSRIVEDLFILAGQPLDVPPALVRKQLSLNELLNHCVRAAQVLAIQKNLDLRIDSGSTPTILKGDDELLKRMMLNLLDNAVKYTPAGGEIAVKLVKQNGNAQIVVRDTGIGIPEMDQPHVFDRFYRVDKARSRSLGGAGLGLSIVRWIVEAHEGRIDLISAPGRGSEFIVQLPLRNESRE